jgi:CheY-like chemotaxis protein
MPTASWKAKPTPYEKVCRYMDPSSREVVHGCEPLAGAFVHHHQGKLVLVVDRDAEMRALVSDCLSEMGLQVVEALDEKDVLRKIPPLEPHVILTELWFPTDGFDYVRQLRESVPFCPLILLSAYGMDQEKAKAMAYGVTVFLAKPIRLGELRNAVLAVLDRAVKSHD